MISDNSIQEVKSRIDIIDVISDFVDLKKSGSNYKALSPFTTEKTPSFYVSPAKNLFKCFSTGKGGDAISFLQEHEGFTYLDAIRFLANKYGVELKEDQFQDSSEERSEKESLYIVLNFAKELYKTLLWENEVGRSVGLGYFRERGLSDSTIKDFELGFSLPQWDNLIKTAKEKGYNSDILEKAGLIIRKEEGREYDRFRDRTIFPIHNITGRVIGFGARQLITDKKQPKYINSPESEVYNKSKELYGLFQARQHIRNEDRCFLVEGYTDVLSMAQAGVKNVVSSSGTSLTDDQIQLLSRYSKNITVLFDGDPAGLKAALRGIDMIIEKGLSVKVLLFPDGHDPDSYLKEHGQSKFVELLQKESKDFIEFKADLLATQGKEDPESRITALREIVESISKIPDSLARSVHLRSTSDKFNLDEGVLYAEVNKRILERRKKQEKAHQSHQTHQGDTPPAPEREMVFVEKESSDLDIDQIIKVQERECLRLLLNYGDEPESEFGYFYKYFFEATDDVEFLDELVREIVGQYRVAIEENILPGLEYFSSRGNEKIKNLIAELHFEKYELSENWELKYNITVLKDKQMLDVLFPRNIVLLKFRHISKKVDQELHKLKNSTRQEEQEEILHHYQQYKSYHMEYAKELGIIVHK